MRWSFCDISDVINATVRVLREFCERCALLHCASSGHIFVGAWTRVRPVVGSSRDDFVKGKDFESQVKTTAMDVT
jgi:hypothetical protein